MSELLKAFDSYNEFERKSFFTLSFNVLPSEIGLCLSVQASKEKINEILKVVNLEEDNFTLQFKKWSTEGSNNADFSKDYPFQFLYKSNSKHCVIWLSLNNDTLTIEFLYDCNDKALEEWIINKHHTLRKTFGLSRTPSFKVLTKPHSYFETEDVRTDTVSANLDINYNDDFKPVNDIIVKAIQSKNSGLILLYGKPGTGKTTYIKSLISDYDNADFIFIQNEFVKNLLDPDFISFMLKQRNSILIIEDAEKVIKSRDNTREESVVSTILQLTDGLFSDYLNIKIICTFNTNLSKIDQALLRKGRLIAMYEFDKLTPEKTNTLLSQIGLKPRDKALTISDIYNHKDEQFDNIKTDTIGFKN